MNLAWQGDEMLLHRHKFKNIHCYLPHVAGQAGTNSHITLATITWTLFLPLTSQTASGLTLARQRKDLGLPRSPSTARAPIGMLSFQLTEYCGLDLLLNAAIAGMRIKGSHRLTR